MFVEGRRDSYALIGLVLCLTVVACGTTQPKKLRIPTVDRPWIECPENREIQCVNPILLGWTHEERRWFYHADEGARLLPLTFYQAIKKFDGQGGFTDENYFKNVILLDPEDATLNEHGLPIGFAVTRQAASPDREGGRYTGKTHVGLTCSVCHTGEIRYKGKRYRIDGGAAMVTPFKFMESVRLSMIGILNDPQTFRTFAKAVYEIETIDSGEPGPEFLESLRSRIWAAIDIPLIQQLETRHLEVPEEGYGRLAAMDRGRHLVTFVLKRPRAFTLAEPPNAPASYPPLWDTPKFDWYHYNASSRQAIARNTLQALALGAYLDLHSYSTGVDYFTLHEIEELLTKLRPPPWPGGAESIDLSLKSEGRKLYERHCMRCHLDPELEVPEDVELKLHKIGDIGTDPALARNARMGNVEAIVVEQMTRSITGVKMKEINADKATQELLRRGRPDRWKGFPLGYRERPLHGVWATAPYLHNGSVPSLWHLLSPQEERPRKFCVGSRALNPDWVGFVTQEELDLAHRPGSRCEAPPPASGEPRWDPDWKLFDACIRGNRNTGHLFDTPGPSDDPCNTKQGIIGPKLTPLERRQLIEYLKTL